MGMRIGTALLVAVALAGCMGVGATDRIVAESGGSFVRVDRYLGANGRPGFAHPASISPERLRTLLQAVQVESISGPFLGQMEKEPLFDPADLDFLAPAVSEALRQAQAYERVVFYLRQSGRLLRSEISTGAIAVTGDAISFTLGHYRRTDVEGLVEEERQADTERELRADPMYGVYDRGVRLFVQAGKPGLVGGIARTVLFPLSAMGSAGAAVSPASPTPPAKAAAVDAPPKSEKADTPPVSSAVSMEALQRQIKELTESNLDLRAKLKELQEQRAQVQDRSAAASEELTWLRQELAEIKQLLADKVVELNRLKGKSEAAPSPSR